MAGSTYTRDQSPVQPRRRSTVHFDDDYLQTTPGTPNLRRPLLREQASIDSFGHRVRGEFLSKSRNEPQRASVDMRWSTPLADIRDMSTPLPQRAQLARPGNQDGSHFPALNPPPIYDRSLPPDFPCDFSDQHDRRGSLPSVFRTGDVWQWRNAPQVQSGTWNDEEDTIADFKMDSSVSSLSSVNSVSKKPKFSEDKGDLQLEIISKNTEVLIHCQIFVLKLARALLLFGAPSHRIEAMLSSTSAILKMDAEFVHFPGIIIVSFGNSEDHTSECHFVKASSRLDLGRVQKLHTIYRQLIHDEIGVEDASLKLSALIKEPELYGSFAKCIFAFGCGAAICPLAFGGSFLDMWVSGCASFALALLNIKVVERGALIKDVFEIFAAGVVSFAARGLSSLPDHMFCYQAISSGSVVLILPGFLVLLSSLELASKHMLTGGTRLVYAIVYTLFLAFALTMGSDLFFVIDSKARQHQALLTAGLQTTSVHNATFLTDGFSTFNWTGTFTFSNTTAVEDVMTTVVNGCYRNPTWPWYVQNPPEWSIAILVPAFAIFTSAINMQPIRSKQFYIAIFIACCSFISNRFAEHYIFDRSDVVSAIGAFVVGVLGHLYSRVFNGTAFSAMVTGVLFLVPSGLSAAGGLADNYRGSQDDYFSSTLRIGARMVQVGIGITVGLLMSGLLVYAFGRKTKRAALFSF